MGLLLGEPHINSELASIGLAALVQSQSADFRARVLVFYQAPEESQREYELWKSGKGPRAAPAWASAHNYALEMNVYRFDAEHARSSTGGGWWRG